VAAERSRSSTRRRSSGVAKIAWFTEASQSFTDFDSTMRGDSHGTAKLATPARGRRSRSCQPTSHAVQWSAPRNGSAPDQPSASRCGARSTG
jgi:hypothetical protein